MFIPKQFQITDFEIMKEFINENSFATIVSTEHGRPIATHVPLLIRQIEREYYITGHLAYTNPQWKTFEDNKQVLVIFQGPHAYVSSSWYSHENVPTWNYQSIHIYGKAQLMNEQELEEDLILLLQKYERHRKNSIIWEKLSSKTKRQIKGIIGVKIKINEAQAAYKLSQNRNEEDYQSIIDHLYEETDINAHQVAEAIEKIRK